MMYFEDRLFHFVMRYSTQCISECCAKLLKKIGYNDVSVCSRGMIRIQAVPKLQIQLRKVQLQNPRA